MLKKLLLLIFISSNCIAQNIQIDAYIKEQLKWFIDTTKSMGNETMNGYKIYILNVYKNYRALDETCFTFGYIINSDEYKYIEPQFYCRIENDIVLIRLSKDLNQDILKEFDLKIINANGQVIRSHELAKIVQKLFPTVIGGITGITEGAVGCFSQFGWHTIYYDNSDAIPLENSIYTSFPVGGEIEYIPKPKE